MAGGLCQGGFTDGAQVSFWNDSAVGCLEVRSVRRKRKRKHVTIQSFHTRLHKNKNSKAAETIPTTRHAGHPDSELRRGCSFSTGADEEQVHQLEQEATPTTRTLKNTRSLTARVIAKYLKQMLISVLAHCGFYVSHGYSASHVRNWKVSNKG